MLSNVPLRLLNKSCVEWINRGCEKVRGLSRFPETVSGERQYLSYHSIIPHIVQSFVPQLAGLFYVSHGSNSYKCDYAGDVAI